MFPPFLSSRHVMTSSPSPTVAIMQWRNEINTHTDGMNVLVWHGASRVNNPKELEKYDVVSFIFKIPNVSVSRSLGTHYLRRAGKLLQKAAERL